MYKPMPIPINVSEVLDLRHLREYNALPPAFLAGNEVIREVYLPLSIKEIGSASFSNCPNLKYVHTGNGVKVIYERFCDNCPSLEKLTISPMLRIIYGAPPKVPTVQTHILVYNKYFAENNCKWQDGMFLTEEEEDWLLAQAGIPRAWVHRLFETCNVGKCSYGFTEAEIVANYAKAMLR